MTGELSYSSSTYHLTGTPNILLCIHYSDLSSVLLRNWKNKYVIYNLLFSHAERMDIKRKRKTNQTKQKKGLHTSKILNPNILHRLTQICGMFHFKSLTPKEIFKKKFSLLHIATSLSLNRKNPNSKDLPMVNF